MRNRLLQHLFLPVTGIILLGTLFAGCSRSKNSTTADLQFGGVPQASANSQGRVTLNGTVLGSENGNVALNQQIALGTRQAQNQANNNQQTETQKGPPMKTLADFETITATSATMTTSKGDITFELYGSKVPITVANFLNLAKSGYYEGIRFHRVIPDFMAQVGDPLTKDESKQAYWGTGGPGYVIPDEFDPTLLHNSEGIVSMANAGPNTGGSQFFITYGPTPWLDGKHAVFGKVTSGMDVLRQIEVGDTILKITYQ